MVCAMTGHPLENGASASPSGLPESDCGPSRTPSHEPSGQSQSAADRHGTQSTSAPEPLQLELGKQSSRPVHERYPPDPTLAGTAQPAASCSVDAEPELPEPVVDLKGWRRPRHQESLPEVHSSIKVPEAWHKKVLAFAGVGILVAVGYMDPVTRHCRATATKLMLSSPKLPACTSMLHVVECAVFVDT